MPTIRNSRRPSLRGWQQVQTPLPQVSVQPSAQPTEPKPARSPFMRASMPLIASTSDALAKQFYSPTGIPQNRILPAQGSKSGRVT